MPAQEIKETNWAEFCERFATEHRGSLMSLEVVHHDGRTEPLATNMPMREFRFERTQGCNDLIRIAFGETQTIQHQIIEPIHMRLREDDGAKKVLQIDAEAGSAELRFSSGRIGALMQDFRA